MNLRVSCAFHLPDFRSFGAKRRPSKFVFHDVVCARRDCHSGAFACASTARTSLGVRVQNEESSAACRQSPSRKAPLQSGNAHPGAAAPRSSPCVAIAQGCHAPPARFSRPCYSRRPKYSGGLACKSASVKALARVRCPRRRRVSVAPRAPAARNLTLLPTRPTLAWAMDFFWSSTRGRS
jgi:hypothetical protein